MHLFQLFYYEFQCEKPGNSDNFTILCIIIRKKVFCKMDVFSLNLMLNISIKQQLSRYGWVSLYF